jgi:hypothetical protein
MDIDATTNLIIYAPLIMGLIAVTWNAIGLPDRAKGLGAVIIGLALAIGVIISTDAQPLAVIIQGIGAGLAATGIHQAGKQVLPETSDSNESQPL